jgi:hypothetical protein
VERLRAKGAKFLAVLVRTHYALNPTNSKRLGGNCLTLGRMTATNQKLPPKPTKGQRRREKTSLEKNGLMTAKSRTYSQAWGRTVGCGFWSVRLWRFWPCTARRRLRNPRP